MIVHSQHSKCEFFVKGMLMIVRMQKRLWMGGLAGALVWAAPGLAQEIPPTARFFGQPTSIVQEVVTPSDQSPADESQAAQPTTDAAGAAAAPVDNSCLWTRPTLTGDWGGYRSCLQQRGVTFFGRSTHYAFGVSGGIEVPPPIPILELGDTFEYTGTGEYTLTFDLEKFGGLPKGSLMMGVEHWYGDWGNVSLNTGAFSPAIFGAALPPVPEGQGDFYLTNFIVTQPLSEKLVVFAGKKDVLGTADQDIFAGGDGTTQFMNQALIANPAFLLGLPYSSLTVGAALPQKWGMISLFALDPQDRTRDVFNFSDIYSQGVILGGEIKRATQIMGLASEQHFGAMWKHVDLTDLSFAEPPPGVYPEPVVPGFPTIDDSYTIYAGFDQFLVQFTAPDPATRRPPKGYGLFGRASISDGNPTPIRYFLSMGIGGDSPWCQSRGDTFGIGWYYVGASNEFGPIPQAVFGPRDGTGVEGFYNIPVTPWLNLTPDIQYIRSEVSTLADDAFIYGIRANVKF